MLGDLVVTKYNSGCLRSILLKSHNIGTEEIPELYQLVGAAAEAHHEAALKAAGELYVREHTIKAQLSENVEYSGRADFVRHLADGTVVDEVKGHTSKNTRLDVIRKGEYNVSYLAQLVSYMVKLRTNRGRLICGYWEEDTNGAYVQQEQRIFRAEIQDDGGVSVDGAPSGYFVADLLAHQRAAVRVLEGQEVGPRPDKWNQKWGGPCQMCAFKAACDTYDAAPCSTEEFLQLAEEAVEALEPRDPPVINKVKPPKRKKGDAA